MVPSRPPVQWIPTLLRRGSEDAGYEVKGNNFAVVNGFLVLSLDTFTLRCLNGWMDVVKYTRDLAIAWSSLQQSSRKFVESLCLEYTPRIRVGEVAALVRRISIHRHMKL